MNDTATPTRTPVFLLGFLLSGCVLAVGTAIIAVIPAPNPLPEAGPDIMSPVAGISKPGEYRNPHFGFELKYDSDWQDVSQRVRQTVTATISAEAKQKSVVLVSLEQDHSKGVMNVTLTSESSPPNDIIDNAHDYLRVAMTRLMIQRQLTPEDIIFEGPTAFAGMRCSRATITGIQTSDGKELRLTFWAGKKGDFILMIAATYSTDAEFRKIKQVLGGMPEEIDRNGVTWDRPGHAGRFNLAAAL